MGRKARILQSLGLNYSSREIAVFSVAAREVRFFLGRASRACANNLEMLIFEFPKNNWGELLFCIDNFSNFASENRRRDEMTKAPDQTTPTPPTQEGKQIVKASYSGGEKDT